MGDSEIQDRQRVRKAKANKEIECQKKLKQLDKLLATLSTGDLLIFSGTENLSKLIKFFTGSQYTHVAMVYRCPITNVPYVWENGGIPHNSGPIICRKGGDVTDARLVPVKTRFAAYKGSVFIRKLIRPHNLNDKSLNQSITQFISAHLGTSYAPDFVTSWNGRGAFSVSLIPLPFLEVSSDGSSWICSQLVAATYEHAKIMDLASEKMQESTYHLMPSDYAINKLPTLSPFDFLPMQLIWNQKFVCH